MRYDCSNCGYDLGGLRVAGHCPECGQAYDRQSRLGITSDVSKAMRRGDALLFWVGICFVVLLSVLLVGAGYVLSLYSSNPLAPLSVGLTLGVGLLLIGVLLVIGRLLGRTDAS